MVCILESNVTKPVKEQVRHHPWLLLRHQVRLRVWRQLRQQMQLSIDQQMGLLVWWPLQESLRRVS